MAGAHTNPPKQRRVAVPAKPSRVAPAAGMNAAMRKDQRPDAVPGRSLSQWLIGNQARVAFSLILSVVSAHLSLPQARPYTAKILTLSYYNPKTGRYGIGYDDFYFIGFCVVLLTGLRAGSMQYVLSPLARRWGVAKHKEATRFAEQGWMLLYYSVFWPLGMYIYWKSPHFLNLRELWTDWPQRDLSGLFKAYLLFQWSQWTQQILAANLEARRKDYWEIMGHHFLTVTLIAASYAYHYTRVANLILVTMDVIELIFPLAKCLKSLGLTTLCDAVFAVFAVTWIATRHGLYLTICWSVYRHAPEEMPIACYKGPADDLQGPFPVPEGRAHLLEPFRDPAGLLCYDNNVWVAFFSYLIGLQAIMSVWSFFLIRVIARVLSGGNAEDVRSEDEAEAEDDKAEVDEAEGAVEMLRPIEEEVGADDIVESRAWQRRAGSGSRTAGSSGIRLNIQSGQKELLNRIGCETKID